MAVVNATRLRILIAEKGLNQKRLSEMTGVSSSLISELSRGTRTSTSLATLSALAGGLGVPVGELLSREEKETPLVQGPTLVPAELVEVPVLGTVPGGAPVLVEEMRTGETIWVPAEAIHGVRRPFALKVQGDSMFPRIQEGHFVVIDPDAFWEDGDVVVAMVGNESTVKRLAVVDGIRRLVADNHDHGYIDPKGQEVRIIGKVVWVQPQGWKP